MSTHATQLPKSGSRDKLLNAALTLIRKKGYAATSVDDLCAQAHVTKGAFFHHFPTKESLGVAATARWSERANALFAAASYQDHSDPLQRLLGYLDFRKALLRGNIPEFTCLAGTLVQEIYESNPEIRDACKASIYGHATQIAVDISAAMKRHRIRADWTAESLALHTQAVIQGAFILAKAKGGATVAASSIDHLRRYIELLFKPKTRKREEIS